VEFSKAFKYPKNGRRAGGVLGGNRQDQKKGLVRRQEGDPAKEKGGKEKRGIPKGRDSGKGELEKSLPHVAEREVSGARVIHAAEKKLSKNHLEEKKGGYVLTRIQGGKGEKGNFLLKDRLNQGGGN